MDNETRNDTITTITTRTTTDLDLGGDDELLETAPLAAYRRAKAHVAVDADLIPVDDKPGRRWAVARYRRHRAARARVSVHGCSCFIRHVHTNEAALRATQAGIILEASTSCTMAIHHRCWHHVIGPPMRTCAVGGSRRRNSRRAARRRWSRPPTSCTSWIDRASRAALSSSGAPDGRVRKVPYEEAAV